MTSIEFMHKLEFDHNTKSLFKYTEEQKVLKLCTDILHKEVEQIDGRLDGKHNLHHHFQQLYYGCIEFLYNYSVVYDLIDKAKLLFDYNIIDTIDFNDEQDYKDFIKIRSLYNHDEHSMEPTLALSVLLTNNVLATEGEKVIPVVSAMHFEQYTKNIESIPLRELVKRGNIKINSKKELAYNSIYLLLLEAKKSEILITFDTYQQPLVAPGGVRVSNFNDCVYTCINFSTRIALSLQGDIRNQLDILSSMCGGPMYKNLYNNLGEKYKQLLIDLDECLHNTKIGKAEINFNSDGATMLEYTFKEQIDKTNNFEGIRKKLESFVGGNGTIGYEYHQGVKKHLVGTKRYNYKKALKDNKLANEIEVDTLE